MVKNTDEDVEIDLLELFYVIRSRLWVIILSGLIVAAAAGIVSKFYITPIYSSKSKLYILSKTTSITSLADIQLGTQLTQDYMVLVKSRPVVTKVIENLEMDITYEQMVSIIKVSNPTNTRILEIRANYQDAYLAKKIVDEFANVSRSQIAKIMDAKEPTVVEEGHVSERPSSPNTKKNAMIGGIIGVVLAAVVIVVIHLMDDTVKSSEDVEKYLGISTLGLIPIEQDSAKQTGLSKKKRKKPLFHSRKGKA